MSEEPFRSRFGLTEREHRWLMALLVLGTVAAAFVVLGYVANMLIFFGDVIMIFFLAWLLAFIISPIANTLVRLVPRLPSAVAVILAYVLLVAVIAIVVVQIASTLATSIQNFIAEWPTIQDKLPSILEPWQNRLKELGLNVDLQQQGQLVLENIKNGASQLVGPLSQIAFASLGIMGNLLFVVMLSLYMAIDKDRILSFLFRLVPPAYAEQAQLLETSISRSFGGFLRGQAVQGVIYAAVAAVTNVVLGLPAAFLPVSAAASGVLHAIPFFGPFVSWSPPVLVAVFFKPDAVVPALVLMFIGWFILMNVIQPRLMADAVGLHPVVVLGSVLIGGKLAGIPGAIFGIPIAAVASAFFFFYLGHSRSEGGTVAVRAARMVEAREGRPIRVPRLPQAGEDEEVEEVGEARAQAHRRRGQPGAPGPVDVPGQGS